MKESWKIINDFPNYAISDLGRVMRIVSGRGTRLGKILKSGKDHDGYSHVSLCKDQKSHTVKVHKLVANSFLGLCPKGKEANHKDGNKENNLLSNFEYVTKSENEKHAFRLNLKHKGSEHWASKLSEQNIFEILGLHYFGWSHRKIAKKFKVARGSIGSILSGKSWSWLTNIKIKTV